MTLTNLDKQDRSQLTDEEALSALLDGELSDFELRRLLRQIENNPALLDTWQRLSLGRSALQGEPFRRASDNFSARVSQAIAAEAPLGDRVKPLSASWKQPLGKMAVAASVAAAVFLGMQYSLMDDGRPVGTEVVDAPYELSGSQQVDADAQRRLNDYIQSVSIPARSDTQVLDFNVMLSTPQLRPVSDRELVQPDQRR